MGILNLKLMQFLLYEMVKLVCICPCQSTAVFIPSPTASHSRWLLFYCRVTVGAIDIKLN